MTKALTQGFLCILLSMLVACTGRTLQPDIGRNIAIKSTALQSSLENTTRVRWTEGNTIKTLENGDGYFPPMLAAIRGAKQSVTFETFAFIDAQCSHDFCQAMAAKAREGVPVHVILDEVGSRRMGKENRVLLEKSGVQFFQYHPRNPFRLIRTNRRTHRKILVIDGSLGFTGGAGFAFVWEGDTRNELEWRDTQYQVEGPVVAQMQEAFTENWEELTGVLLKGEAYFPTLKSHGKTRAQFVYDSTRNARNPIAHAMLHAINSAREEILLEQSYFIPNEAFRVALISAASRGVKIEVIMPDEKIDSKESRNASQNHWRELLEAGVKLYEFTPSMMHAKLLIADRTCVIVGSANLDQRSFFINDEGNLHVIDEEFAQDQVDMFLRDKRRSREVTLQNINALLNPWYRRAFARIIEPQL